MMRLQKDTKAKHQVETMGEGGSGGEGDRRILHTLEVGEVTWVRFTRTGVCDIREAEAEDGLEVG